jgi:GAF domain-containing protein
MKNQPTQTGAKSVLPTLRLAQEGRSWALVHTVVAYTGWLLLLIVVALTLLSPDLRTDPSRICAWLLAYLGYELVLEILSRTRKTLYETAGFRLIRIQIMMLFGSVLVFLTGGTGSLFWFVYLWPLFATALYTSWAWTWIIFVEMAVQYLVVSLLWADSLAKIDPSLFLANLIVLLVVTVVLRLFLDTIRRYQAAQGKVEYYELLQSVQKDVETAVDLDAVLDKILQRAVHSVGARDGTLMLLDEAGELRFRGRYGRSLPAGSIERSFKRGEGIAGWVLQSGEPYICTDTKTDSHFEHVISGASIGSLVCVPISLRGSVLGVINVDSLEADCFSQADAELLLTLADQTAVAIERAELLDGLTRISAKTLSGAEDLHQTIVDAVYRLTRCPVAVWRVDPENNSQATIIAMRNLRDEYVDARVLQLDSSIVGEVIRTADCRAVLDIQTDPRVSQETKTEAAICGWKSLLVVPLLTQPGAAAGALSIYSPTRKEFTRPEIDLLQAFAGPAGVAMQNAERLQALSKVSPMVSSGVNLKEVGGKILDVLKETIDYRTASLQLIRAGTRTLIAGRGFEEQMASEWLLRPITEDRLVNRVVSSGKPLILSEPEKDPDWEFRPETVDVRSWVGLPLMRGDQTIGLLTLDHDQPGFYSPSLMDFLVSFASQAATAVNNAERANQLMWLQEVTSAISTQLAKRDGLKEVSLLIVNRLRDIFPEASSGVRLYDSQTDVFEPLVVAGFLEEKGFLDQQPRPDGGSRFLIHQTPLRPRYLEADMLVVSPDGGPTLRESLLPFVKTTAYLPLVSEGNVVGILYLDFTTPHRFSSDDKQILELFANQAAIAIRNAKLFQQERQRSEALDLLREISEQINTSLELDKSLGLIVEGAMQLTGMDSGVVHLVDDSGYSIVRSHEFPLDFHHSIPRLTQEKSLTRTILDSGELIAVPDTEQEARVNEVMIARGIKSLIGLPLQLRGKVIGVLYLNATQPRRFRKEDLSFLRTLADQAAIAIEKVRLYEHISRDLERRIKALEVLSGIYEKIIRVGVESIDGILDLIYTEIAKVVDLTDAQVQFAFYDETKDEVIFPLAIERDCDVEIDKVRWARREPKYKAEVAAGDEGEDGMVIQYKPRASRVRPGLTEYVIREKKPLLIEKDFEKEATSRGIEVWPTFGIKARPTYCWLGVPMVVQDRVIGIISIQSLEQENAFDEYQVELLSSVASQAAVAIENARLFDREKRWAQALTALQDIGVKITAHLDLVEVLGSIVESADAILSADFCTLFVYDPERCVFERGIRRGKIETAPSVPSSSGSTAKIAENQNALFLDDAKNRPDIKPVIIQDRWVRSFAGIALVVGAKTVGVLYVNFWDAHHFSEEERAIIRLFASQAAVAIENARLYEEMERRVEERTRAWKEAQEKVAAVERLSLMSDVGAQFAHRMNNLAGTIPVRVNMARAHLNPNDAEDLEVIKQLDGIRKDAAQLLQAAQEIKRSTEIRSQERVEINDLLEIALDRVWLSQTTNEEITVYKEFANHLPSLTAERNRLLDTFVSVIKNAVEAMPQGGSLTVSTRIGGIDNQPCLEVSISDTGIGILKSDLPKIFDLFFTTKSSGLGFGLWRDRNFITGLGGSIDVESEVGEGTRFIIKLPLGPEAVSQKQ